MKIMVVKDIEREDIEFVCKVITNSHSPIFNQLINFLFQTLNCRPIASLDHFLPEYLASADLVESVPTGTSKVVKVKTPFYVVKLQLFYLYFSHLDHWYPKHW